jgi:hypothetical protein
LTKTDFENDFRIILGGNEKHLHAVVHPIVDQAVRFSGVVGTSWMPGDIETERPSKGHSKSGAKDQLYKENLAPRDEVDRTDV